MKFNNEIRKVIREMVEKTIENKHVNEVELDEERITNVEAADKVKNRENFVGSHTYGEDLGGLGLMYVAYSYGEQHPLYMYYNGSWYHNMEDYLLDDGEPNIWTKKHLRDLAPNGETKPRSLLWMQKTINNFKKKYKLGDNNHTDLEPGEK
jgi:hypothetical protein